MNGATFKFSLFLVLLTGMAFADAAAQRLQLYTPLNVDGSATTASTTLQIYNPNAAPLKYSLSIQNAVAKNTNQDAGWVVSFYGVDNKPAGPIVEDILAGGKSRAIRVDISHVVEAGETTAELRSNNVKIAELTLKKDQGLPFRVFLDGNPPEKPKIQFVKGEPVDLRWKNDDGMSYPLSWEVFLKGKAVPGKSTVGPNGSTKFSVTPDNSWFSLYQSFFRDEIVDGTVIVGYQPQRSIGAYPSKTIPIEAHLSYYDRATRDLVATGIVFGILALGGYISSLLNVDLVNRLKAISIGKRLGRIARSIGEIGPQLSSQLRVALWLDRARIESTLPSSGFTSETTEVLKETDADTDALKQRVDLSAKVRDAIISLDHAIDTGVVAPTLAEKVIRLLSVAQELLKKSVLNPGELERITSLLGAAANILDRIGESDEDLEKAIGLRLQELKKTFTGAFRAGTTCAALEASAPIPFGLLDGAAAGSQVERDMNTRKLALIADLVPMKSTDPAIVECLQRQDFVSLQMAELLLTEIKEGISLKDLRQEISANPPGVFIKLDRETVRVNTPIMMKLVFNKSRYNRATARRRIECTWSIDGKNLVEKDWEVYQYFAKAKTCVVKATFKDIDQAEIQVATPVQRDVMVVEQKTERGNPTAIERRRWALGFLVALIGLLAGAKEKILSLDTVAAILAVFLIGFGVDMARNLLSPK